MGNSTKILVAICIKSKNVVSVQSYYTFDNITTLISVVMIMHSKEILYS